MAFKLDELSSRTSDIEPTEKELSGGIEAPPAAKSIRKPRSKGLMSGVKNESLKIGDRNISSILKYIKVEECTVWEGNARRFNALTESDIEDIFPSIQSKGVLEPVLGRKTPNGYELVDGSRRLFAAKLAGIEEIPVRVSDLSDDEAQLLTIVSNNNARLSPYEIGLFSTANFGKYFSNDEDIYSSVGVSRANYYRCKNISKLPDYVLDLIQNPNDIPLVSGDELYRLIKDYVKNFEEIEFIKFCKKQLCASAAVTVSILSKWLKKSLNQKAAEERKNSINQRTGRAQSFKNGSGNVVLKATNTSKGTLKIELLLEDEEIRLQVLDYAKKLSGC